MKSYVLILATGIFCWATLAMAGEKVFVAGSFANQVDVIDTPALAPQTIAVGLTPRDVKVTPDGKTLFAVNYLSNDLTEIDVRTLAVRRTIDLSCMPSAMVISPDGSTGYAICRNIERLIYIDLLSGSEISGMRVSYPFGIAMTPDGQRAYVSRWMFSRSVDVVDLTQRKVTASITVGSAPQGIIVGPSGLSVYTANTGAKSVSVIDTTTNKVRATIAVGSYPCAVAVDSAEKFLFVANKNDASVSVVDLELGKTVMTIPVGVAPQALALSIEQPLLYVANYNSNTVSVVDTQSYRIIATIPVANGPLALAIAAPLDTTPPQVSLTLNDEILWPPNHKLVPIKVEIVVADDQDPHPTVQLLSITSNEPCSESTTAVKSPNQKSADPSTCNDIAGADLGTTDNTFLLRAERFGYGEEGRIYTITYKATDAAGNETIASTAVRVPLNFSGEHD